MLPAHAATSVKDGEVLFLADVECIFRKIRGSDGGVGSSGAGAGVGAGAGAGSVAGGAAGAGDVSTGAGAVSAGAGTVATAASAGAAAVRSAGSGKGIAHASGAASVSTNCTPSSANSVLVDVASVHTHLPCSCRLSTPALLEKLWNENGIDIVGTVRILAEIYSRGCHWDSRLCSS
jgi:hypothetical protein